MTREEAAKAERTMAASNPVDGVEVTPEEAAREERLRAIQLVS